MEIYLKTTNQAASIVWCANGARIQNISDQWVVNPLVNLKNSKPSSLRILNHEISQNDLQVYFFLLMRKITSLFDNIKNSKIGIII